MVILDVVEGVRGGGGDVVVVAEMFPGELLAVELLEEGQQGIEEATGVQVWMLSENCKYIRLRLIKFAIQFKRLMPKMSRLDAIFDNCWQSESLVCKAKAQGGTCWSNGVCIWTWRTQAWLGRAR